MAMDIAINAVHAICYPSKVLATRVGHTYNIVLTENTDNGAIVGRGDWVAFDNYEETTAPTAFKGVIRDRAQNGNWYVEVTAVDPQKEAILIYETVITTREDRDLRQEKLYFNEKDQVVEGISLTIGDIFELSAEGFDGTPEAGKGVTVNNKKLKVAA